MLKEVVISKAHIVEQGAKMKYFQVVAVCFNSNQLFRLFVNEKAISELFKALMKGFVQMCNADEASSGNSYEYNECNRLLAEVKWQMEATGVLERGEQVKKTEKGLKIEHSTMQILARATANRNKKMMKTKTIMKKTNNLKLQFLLQNFNVCCF